MDDEVREAARALERGEVGARTRLLAARLRAGLVDDARLAIAAMAGDADARAALGRAAPEEAKGVWAWLTAARVHAWGEALGVHAAVVAVHAAMPLLEQAFPQEEAWRRFVASVRALVGCPCARHAQELEAAHAPVAGLTGVSPHVLLDRDPLRAVEQAALHAATACRSPGGHDALTAVGRALMGTRGAIRPAIRREAVAWLLGT